jgi:hypothetical protein
MMKLLRTFKAGAMLLVGAFVLVASAVGIHAAEPAEEAAEKPAPARQVRGADLGGTAAMVYVARDKATWDAVKKAVGERHEFPRSAVKGESPQDQSLERLDNVDFQQDMIVAIFWGEMNFSGHEEKCWIEAVDISDRQVSVACRANLWGGYVKRSYRAWPYEARVVRRSDLPVTFVQDTEYKADPNLMEKNKVLATLKPDQWKLEISPPK